jgi:hypothetical protein
MPAGTYDQFPGIDSDNNFAPEVRSAFMASTDVKAAIDARATTVANAKVAAATAVRQYQNYRWADQGARLAQTGMRKFDRGVQLDNGQEWQYDGAAWQTYLFAKSALTDIQTLDIPGNYRVTSLSMLFNLMNDDSKRPAPGSIIHVGYSPTSGNSATDYHFGSIWRVVPAGDKAEPIPGSPILVDTTNSLSTIGNLCAPGGAWNSRMTLDHMVSQAETQRDGASRRLEWRWSASGASNGQPQWRLWPSASTYSVINYSGGTDQVLADGGWATPVLDTVEFDGLYCDYLGTSGGAPKASFRLNYEGRYRIEYQWAPCVSDGNDYLQTIYNESVGGDTFTVQRGVIADWGVRFWSNRWYYGGNTIHASIYKAGGVTNWVRRGSGANNFDSNKPRLWITYLGWS